MFIKNTGIILFALSFALFFTTLAVAEDISKDTLLERIQALENNTRERISLSGLIEVEAGLESTDYGNNGDIVLSTVELGVDVDIVENISGRLLFLYEEDDTEPMDIDEGFITIEGGDTLPLSLSVGKMYVPFGNFESHFISYPLTLEIGETNQSAASVGFATDMMEITMAVFNGDINETGEDDIIGSFALSAVFILPSDVVENVGMTAGVSLINNIGDTDGLEGETPGELSSHVAGFSVFASLSLKDKYFLEVEYLGAMDDFEAGELSFDGREASAPRAWNLEFGMAMTERLKMALKYEGSKDLGDFLPESQFGIAAAWDLFENIGLAVEYLRGELAEGGDTDAITAQVAVEF